LFRDPNACFFSLKALVYDAEKYRYNQFISSFLATAEALQQDPISTRESGKYEVNMRPGNVRPYADVRNQIANDIANLPKFTARVKIALDDTRNVEHSIKTLAPGQVIARSLPQRIATIQAQNRKPDQFGRVYCRSRKEVEAEITNRQSSWDGSSPARPQQQARHARQVPVQGKCPNCGASNSPGSQFCNKCGTKL